MSITGARFVSDKPPPVGTAVHCTLQERKVAALVVRRTGDGFAIRFDETLNTRVELIRAFYSGDYVSAFTGIRAASVGKALMMRIFGLLRGWNDHRAKAANPLAPETILRHLSRTPALNSPKNTHIR